MSRMPTIAVLAGGITIAMYYNDHAPPHFHAKRGSDEFRLRIADLRLLHGDIGPTVIVRTVRDWAAQHQAELAMCWTRSQSGQQPGRISP
jgi:Domain of unknown function (DUF4160)